jgi:hypothetical protein
MSTNYYLNNYSTTEKTIFQLEKDVIDKLNDYNDAYFKLGTCKYIVQNFKSSTPEATFNTSTREFTGATDDVTTTFNGRGCANAAYTYTPNGNTYNVTNTNLTDKLTALETAVTKLNDALGATDRVGKDKYDTSMNHINNLVTQINNLRGEYDPKLQDIIENSNRSVSQQSIDSAAYIGVIMSIGLASLLFFTFVRSS